MYYDNDVFVAVDEITQKVYCRQFQRGHTIGYNDENIYSCYVLHIFRNVISTICINLENRNAPF